MAALPNIIQSLGNYSKILVSIDGNRIENVREVTVPDVKFKELEVDNTSTGGTVGFLDPARVESTDMGNIIVEGYTFLNEELMSNPSIIRTLLISCVVDYYSPTLSQIIPVPITISVQAQFGNSNNGTITQSSKADNTYMFKMFAYKLDINNIVVKNYDFLGGVFDVAGEDILLSIRQLLG